MNPQKVKFYPPDFKTYIAIVNKIIAFLISSVRASGDPYAKKNK